MADDAEWGPRILEAPKVERVSALGELGVTLKILGTVRASEQWAVGGELRKRLLEAFQQNGIEIPQPQRVVLAQTAARDAAQPGGGTAAGTGAGAVAAEAASASDATLASAAVAAQDATTSGAPERPTTPR